jgi:WD40 repeat protein
MFLASLMEFFFCAGVPVTTSDMKLLRVLSTDEAGARVKTKAQRGSSKSKKGTSGTGQTASSLTKKVTSPASGVVVELCKSVRLIAVAHANHTITLWHADSYAAMGALPCLSMPQVMAWSVAVAPPELLCFLVALWTCFPSSAPRRCPNAKLLFVGFTDGTLRGYSVDDHRVVVEVKRHTDIVLSLLWIPKYEMLLSTSVDPQVLGWDVLNGGARVKVGGSVVFCCLAPVSCLCSCDVGRRRSSRAMKPAFVRLCTPRHRT